MTRWLRAGCACATLLLTACGNPPNKEMDQAQGGIDAARAAGADRYAAAEYTAATEALTRSQNAVAQRDYRLALNEALESREHAQNAAREAADTKAQLRGEVEREMAEIAALTTVAHTRLAAATRAGPPRRAIEGPRTDLAAAEKSVQEAGAAMKAGDYLSARAALQGVKTKIAHAVSVLAPPAAQSSRRSR